MEELVLAVDAGTQALKVGLFDLRGRVVATESAPYPTSHPAPGWAEQNPRHWWNALVECCGRAVTARGIDPERVKAVCVCATSSTVIPVDSVGRPLSDAIMWMDARAFREAQEISATHHDVLRYAGGQTSSEWMVPKALWLKRHKPNVFHDAALIVEQLDWLNYMLTGRWTASVCNVTCKWHYVGREGGWNRQFCRDVGLDEMVEKWPGAVLQLGETVGGLSRPAAERLGLAPGTPVAQGCIDAHSGMFGLNSLDPGTMGVVLGTSNVHLALSERPLSDPGLWGPYPDAVLPGTWLLEGGQLSAGSIVKWFRDTLGAAERAEAERAGVSPYQVMDREAAEVPPGSEGLVVLDHWQGNRTPIRDPISRGVIAGLTLRHGRGHIIRAIYESCAFGCRQVLEAFARAGYRVCEVRACGGATQSPVWLRIYVDVCRIPFVIPEVQEASLLGSAVLAAVAAGAYREPREAAGSMVRPGLVVEPDAAGSEAYEGPYAAYSRLYPSTKDVLHSLALGPEQGEAVEPDAAIAGPASGAGA